MTQGTGSNTALAVKTLEIYDNGRLIGTTPIDIDSAWTYQATDLEGGQHKFTAKLGVSESDPWLVEVNSQSINATVPFVEGVPPPSGDTQTFDYYTDVSGDIHVTVPNYNMISGDTVKIYWVGRSTTLGSEIQTVGKPPIPLTFKISKYEVIDVIGYNTTQVYYTVRRSPTEPDVTSRHLRLSVTGSGQSFEVSAPILNGAHDKVNVWRQSQFNSTSTVRVRAVGMTEWESYPQEFKNSTSLDFAIDAGWLNQNRGQSVAFNYSLRLRDDADHYLFSQLLRVDRL